MTIDELSKMLRISKSYIKTHWYKVIDIQRKNGIIIVREGDGDSAIYSMQGFPHFILTAEELCNKLGLSEQYLRKNFVKIRQKKEEEGMVIRKIGRGSKMVYGIDYK